MSETPKKNWWSMTWKLALVAVPVIISNIGSYAKARAEAKDENQAAYEALKKAVLDVQGDVKECSDRSLRLEGHVEELEKIVNNQSKMFRADALPPGVRPLVPEARPESHFSAPKAASKLDLPEKFDDVVQQFKAKK